MDHLGECAKDKFWNSKSKPLALDWLVDLRDKAKNDVVTRTAGDEAFDARKALVMKARQAFRSVSTINVPTNLGGLFAKSVYMVSRRWWGVWLLQSCALIVVRMFAEKHVGAAHVFGSRTAHPSSEGNVHHGLLVQQPTCRHGSVAVWVPLPRPHVWRRREPPDQCVPAGRCQHRRSSYHLRCVCGVFFFCGCVFVVDVFFFLWLRLCLSRACARTWHRLCSCVPTRVHMLSVCWQAAPCFT